MDISDWIIGIVLLILFLLFATVNATVFWKGVVKGEKVGSGVPLVGGIFGTIAFVNLPVPFLNQYAWLPLILDVGCVPGLIVFVYVWLTEKEEKN